MMQPMMKSFSLIIVFSLLLSECKKPYRFYGISKNHITSKAFLYALCRLRIYYDIDIHLVKEVIFTVQTDNLISVFVGYHDISAIVCVAGKRFQEYRIADEKVSI